MKEKLKKLLEPTCLLDTSVSTENALRQNFGRMLLGDLIQKTEEELLSKKGIGPKTTKNIKIQLKLINLSLGTKGPLIEAFKKEKALRQSPEEALQKLSFYPKLIVACFFSEKTIKDLQTFLLEESDLKQKILPEHLQEIQEVLNTYLTSHGLTPPP